MVARIAVIVAVRCFVGILGLVGVVAVLASVVVLSVALHLCHTPCNAPGTVATLADNERKSLPDLNLSVSTAPAPGLQRSDGNG